MHIISSLNDGGAEAVLFRLCTHDQSNRHTVISLMDEGKYGPLLKRAGITVYCLDIPRGLLTPGGIWRLARLLRRHRPNVVQTWMYHADLIGGLMARLVGIRRVCWGLHNSNLDADKTKKATILVARFNAFISRWVPIRIISCSQQAASVHQALGYPADKFAIVPNGYDLSQFKPTTESRMALRREWAIADGLPLLGMVGRFDPQKDHLNLITALGIIKRKGHDFRCVLVGQGLVESNAELLSWLACHDVSDRVLLLGPRGDIPAVMNALDIHVLSSSYGEAFPNVLCEAMACATPCVTTDVGDAGLIVGDTGWVVEAGAPDRLADMLNLALGQMRSAPKAWQQRRLASRTRIVDNFCIDKMVAGYTQTWMDL